ncbi:hypothetical protein [Luteolibacter soli]|uniref:Tfp pilus assembly protein PilX n=1 Tax=Luteolibacter soli TaxID=3135280 RepID=A0ABU9AU77_9BACT
MKNPRAGASLLPIPWRKPRGFALVISLSLMVLLTVLAVGLLGLSSLSLRTSTRETDLAEARANARMSLELAIAQLQKHTGPDQRVTMTADQLSSGSGEETAAGSGKSHWTGVYNSWGSTATARPTPQFRSWLVSGEYDDVKEVDTAKGSVGKDDVELVGTGTVGDSTNGSVRVPALRVSSSSGGSARLGWWTGDQGTKAAMATPPVSEDASIAATRSTLHGAPRNAVEFASDGTKKPFAKLDLKDPKVAMMTDWQQSGFLASDPHAPRGLFHDIAPFSTGLLTNQRSGGFRKDLSMRLELPATTASSRLATTNAANVLYKVGSENGINLYELWCYYNLCKELKTSGSFKYTSGGTLTGSTTTPYLTLDSGAAACAADDEFHYKMPVVVSSQMILSLMTVGATNAAGQAENQLQIVADPLITLWNPLDVPVVIPTSSFFTMKYFGIPYDLIVTVGTQTYTCPIIQSFSDSDSNYLSVNAGETQQLVFKPGEVIKLSQETTTLTQGKVTHQLKLKAGFNPAKGLRYPLKAKTGATDASGKDVLMTINVPSGSTVKYRAKANTLTAGTANGSGSVPKGWTDHSRHFSTTHNELYIGYDRKEDGPSLGYGGLYVDFDYGNKRIKPSDAPRQKTDPGTKPTNQRLNATQRPEVFKEITEAMGRPLAAGALTSKAPIMMISYNAKTEASTDPAARTRYLSRFNPRAHHTDFYDLSQKERDMLPYEFVVEPLLGWKNRFLDSSDGVHGFFGGGLNQDTGSPFVTTHSIPREPAVSLAALQHSCANGFEILKPKDGYASLSAREPMLPQISHAIGNSMAPSVLAPGQTESSLTGGRPLADHSYLANLNLWDDWFFSGISPQDRATYTTKKRNQRQVAQEFLESTAKLPTVRYLPETGGAEVNGLLTKLFSGSTPTETAIQLAASLIRVDGMFNVNSTSVEAWKALLGGLKGRGIVVRTQDGKESVSGADENGIPVTGLFSPTSEIADPKGDAANLADSKQWNGRRVLTEGEIEQLAKAIVKEVRKRGPFLSLSDFVNRRPGSDKALARAGAIQSALDSNDVDINSGWKEGNRGMSTTVTSRFAFPEAEQGTAGYGMPGIVKQADILTPIAPILSARSDSFIIRAYGESVDKDGKVLARAWCEATVERSRDFVSSADAPEATIASLKAINKSFGRRYEMTAFRWLHPDEV